MHKMIIKLLFIKDVNEDNIFGNMMLWIFKVISNIYEWLKEFIIKKYVYVKLDIIYKRINK